MMADSFLWRISSGMGGLDSQKDDPGGLPCPLVKNRTYYRKYPWGDLENMAPQTSVKDKKNIG
jgi:hypothetical protein